MNFVRWTLLVCLVSLVSVVGCQPTEDGGDSGATSAAVGSETETVAVSTTILCGKCGEVKGSTACCTEDAETCECGMHKGTPLCCASLAADVVGKDLCATCGHVAEEGHTCDSDCEKCAACGLHKGSPACCKLKTAG